MYQNAGCSPNEVFPQINVINCDYSSYFRGTGRGWKCLKYKFGDCIIQSNPQV